MSGVHPIRCSLCVVAGGCSLFWSSQQSVEACIKQCPVDTYLYSLSVCLLLSIYQSCVSCVRCPVLVCPLSSRFVPHGFMLCPPFFTLLFSFLGFSLLPFCCQRLCHLPFCCLHFGFFKLVLCLGPLSKTYCT